MKNEHIMTKSSKKGVFLAIVILFSVFLI